MRAEDHRALVDAILADIGVPDGMDGTSFGAGRLRETECVYDAGRAPVCHVVAGANGSGKSTFALHFLPRYASCLEFVNPDLIAGGLSPFDPARSAVKAGKLVLERIREISDERHDFGFETTLSGRGYLAWFETLKRIGYHIHLYYLWVPGATLLVSRIRQRVASGGHFVPDGDVMRRYVRSFGMFPEYARLVDKVRLFDNSGAVPVLTYEKNGDAVIHDALRFEQIKRGIVL